MLTNFSPFTDLKKINNQQLQLYVLIGIRHVNIINTVK